MNLSAGGNSGVLGQDPEGLKRRNPLTTVTFRDLRVLGHAPAQGQGDVGEVAGGVGQAVGAAVRRAAADRLGRVGHGAPSQLLHPVPGLLLGIAAGGRPHGAACSRRV